MDLIFMICALMLIAGVTLLCDTIPNNDGFGWTFSGIGALGMLISGAVAVGGVA